MNRAIQNFSHLQNLILLAIGLKFIYIVEDDVLFLSLIIAFMAVTTITVLLDEIAIQQNKKLEKLQGELIEKNNNRYEELRKNRRDRSSG